jgi:hypothetical protein
MKTDASFTKRKPKVSLTQAVKLIHHWTKTQLGNVTNKQMPPICLPVGDKRLMVGAYSVEKLSGNIWRVRDNNRELVHDFVSRPSAVFFCVCVQTNQIPLSHELLKNDNQLGLLESELSILNARFKRAITGGDKFVVQLYAAKLVEAIAHRKKAKAVLEKTLRSAKYLKLWENMP